MPTETTLQAKTFALRLKRLANGYHLSKLSFEQHREANRAVWAEVEKAGLNRQVAALVSAR